jgi:NAD:arginine ADP-ribosyltransferase
MLSHAELEAYKRRFPDASLYEPLKSELGPDPARTAGNAGGAVAVGAGGGVLGYLLAQSEHIGVDVPHGAVPTPLPGGVVNLSAYRSDAATRSQLPPAPADLKSFLQRKHPDIPVEDLLAIRAYSAKEYTRINDALDDRGDVHAMLAFIQCTASGLGALPSFVGVAYRGAVLSAQSIAHYQVGSVVTERRFVSASASASFAETWRAGACNVVFIIQSRATGHSVAHLSAKPEEAEILFTPGTRFRVLRNEHDPVKNKTFITLDEHAP